MLVYCYLRNNSRYIRSCHSSINPIIDQCPSLYKIVSTKYYCNFIFIVSYTCGFISCEHGHQLLLALCHIHVTFIMVLTWVSNCHHLSKCWFHTENLSTCINRGCRLFIDTFIVYISADSLVKKDSNTSAASIRLG